jgi:hypothetical protein
MDEREPPIERDTAVWVRASGKPENGVADGSAFERRDILDQIVEDDGAGGLMEEHHFLYQRIALERKLIQVCGPARRRRVPQSSADGYAPFLERHR